MRIRASILLVMLIVLTACAAPPTQVLPAETATQTPAPSPTRTIQPTATDLPTATAIPGFEDWSVFKPEAVNIQTDGDALVLTLVHQALWFMNQRGVFLYKPVSGNFRITADVHTSKHFDPSQPPGGDGSAQLGGLMVRSGKGGSENYVFIVAGDDGNGTSIETKNTVDGISEYDGPAWDSPDAELRICRIETTFHLYKRHLGTEESWIPAATFDRADLPETVQVGVNIYSDSEPDLQIRYENISIKAITDGAGCEAP
jgi:hypothetical protein